MGTVNRIATTFVALVAAVAPSRDTRVTASVCDLLRSARKFSGQIVLVRARVIRSPEFHALLDTEDENCGWITIENPEQKGVNPKPPFGLVRDSNNELFENATILLLGPSRT